MWDNALSDYFELNGGVMTFLIYFVFTIVSKSAETITCIDVAAAMIT